MDEATIEDLAFGVRPSREVNIVDLRVCLRELRPVGSENTQLLPQRVKSCSVSGFTLLFEEPCPLSLQTVFFTHWPSQIYREEQMENGVKNLNGSEVISKNLLQILIITDLEMLTNNYVFLTRKALGNKIERMKIVVRAPNWIGDSILSLPAIDSLSKNFPKAQVWVAAREWVKDLFASHEFIKGIIPLPNQPTLKNLKDSAQKLKKIHFDIGVLLTNSFSSALLFYLAKIPQRWGYQRDGRGLLLTKGVSPKNQEHILHQVNYYLELILGLGLKTSSPQINLPLTHEEKRQAKETLLSLNVNFKKPLVILNPGAYYGSAKRWPASKYAELARLFQQRKEAEILIIGSPDEAELAESITSRMIRKPLNLAGKTDLRLLADIISHAALFITNDSGPMHMANALKIPVIAIFGPTDPRFTGPFQEPACIIKKDVPCWPCTYRECPFDHSCMLKIEPEEVFEAGQNFL